MTVTCPHCGRAVEQERDHFDGFVREWGCTVPTVASTPSRFRDRAGREQQITGDPLMTAPLHPWDGDAEGHNCTGCPDGSIWRCDRLAHTVELKGTVKRVPYCYRHKHFIDGPFCTIPSGCSDG